MLQDEAGIQSETAKVHFTQSNCVGASSILRLCVQHDTCPEGEMHPTCQEHRFCGKTTTS